MLHYDRIDVSEEIEVAKCNRSKEGTIYHYWYFRQGHFLLGRVTQFQKSICNGCNDLLMLSLDISGITIFTVKGIDYYCIISGISKSDPIYWLQNYVSDDFGLI